MGKTITIRISGGGPETDAPSIVDLLDQLRDYFDLLLLVEQTMAEDGQNAIVWRVTSAAKINPLTFTIQPFPRQFAVNVDERAGLVVDRAISGLQLLEGRAERPIFFSEKALLKAESLFERVTNGLERTEIVVDDAPRVTITPAAARSAARNTRSILEPAGKPYKEIGSVEGYCQSVGKDGHGRRILYITPRLTGDEVKCVVSGEAARELEHFEVGDVWRGRRVSVFGTLHYKAAGYIWQIEASHITFLRKAGDLPDIADILDPNFTGGLRSEDYLERLRDGNLS
jgi:hypothetical protein